MESTQLAPGESPETTPSEPMPMSRLLTTALLGVLATGAHAQQASGSARILSNGDEVHRAARIALTGDLGLPALEPVRANSARTSIYFADRVPHAPQAAAAGTPPTMFDGFIPKGPGGTETDKPEIFKYQLGNSYDANGPAHPLVVAYHGFSNSANSVGVQSLIDEEADARGWVYLAPTGLDDGLFGSPICQQHIQVVIQWMLDNHNVDPERIYMLGFSMGGGVASSFTARHRDPDGIMIAALGLVSGTYDWTLTWNDGIPATQTWLEHPYNFGDTPSNSPWAYQQSSALYFDPSTYPALPGVLDSGLSMATNLHAVPTYITYDTGDTILHIPPMNEAYGSLLSTIGTEVTTIPVSGTVDGSGAPAAHSWWVLDEADLFDFFDGRVAARVPAEFAAQQDLGGPASWIRTTQLATGAFTWVGGSADPLNGTIVVADVENAALVEVDVGAAGLTSMPVQISASSAPGHSFELRLTGFPQSPSYMLDASSGDIVTLVDSDPASGSLIYRVESGATLNASVQHDLDWTASFTTTPNPVAIGNTTRVEVDASASATGAWLIVALDEALLSVKGVHIAVVPVPPALVLFVPLDAQGDVSFPADIPGDPLLQGLRLPTQAILTNGSASPDAVTNLWGFRFD